VIEQQLAELLDFVATHDGVSTARAAKRLGLGQSQLQRLLAVLGEDDSFGGLGLLMIRESGPRRVLSLSPRGREWMEAHS